MTDRELLEEILKRVISTEETLHKTNLHIENEIWPAIQKLAEGHELILERMDDKVERRTEQLQSQLDVHQAAIMRIDREIQELKKAQ